MYYGEKNNQDGFHTEYEKLTLIKNTTKINNFLINKA